MRADSPLDFALSKVIARFSQPTFAFPVVSGVAVAHSLATWTRELLGIRPMSDEFHR